MTGSKFNFPKYILIIFCCFFTIKSIIVPWTFFISASFRMDFYDLGLISDFLANTAKGKTFFVDTYDISHLSLHWTPTLFLLVPFFKFFESQFLTVILGNIIGCFSIIYFLTFIYRKILSKFTNKLFLISSTIFLSLLFFSNKFINANFVAGHFEIIYFSFSLLTLTMLLENRSFLTISIPLILALGVREDMGLFLSFQLLSLLFIPKNIIPLEKKTKFNILYMIILCTIVVILNLTVFMPLMRADKAYWINRFWSHWGNSGSEIIFNVLTHPIEVIKALINSGMTGFNEAFFYLGIFNPLQWICVHIPGTILFLSNATDKNNLFWYNSAMMLPGFYIASIVGMLVMYNFIRNKIPKYEYIFSGLLILISIILLVRINRASNSEDYKLKYNNKLENFDKVLIYINKYCKKEPQIFATDHKTFSFLPNSKTKYLLDKFEKAEVVIIGTPENFEFVSDRCDNNIENENCLINYNNSFEKITQNSDFKLLYQDKYYQAFYDSIKIDCK
ncbi:DUF2079 domain-containing protein [Pigmentibacter sp. JX0631]|uniref:DUF2079 domain-containing protein n=1 Tax=Pigmentibacter sp. JX0631 TaxID=2976982 RepID=UPI0024683CA5|nr:DUF2079 domain-containing protein [Pigmentibacter sp. JX0631]WGL60652.1 DUF2079 domain-containing protein [Pigmentibacter sp. JX0631]